MLRKLFPYYGLRVRKFYRHIKVITYFLLLQPLLIGLGIYAWIKRDVIVVNPLFYSLLLSGILVASMIIVYVLQKELYLSRLFFSRLDNHEVMANFLLENNYYISKKGASKGKEKIKLPKVYLKRTKYALEATFILRGNKFQDRFLQLGKQLEVMYDGDFMDKSFTKGYVTYTIAIDQFSGRINVADVKVTNKGLMLMNGVYWNFNEQPHLLIGGGTGGGKTVTLMSIIYGLIKVGYVWIADPKKSDFVGLKDVPVFHGKVAWEKDDMIALLEDAVTFMNKRYLEMTNHPEYRAGKRYSDYGMKPLFILFDEWAAFMAEVSKDYRAESTIIDLVTQIVLKGRQAGIFMVLAMQRPDGEYIKTALRDNFMKRLSVGHLEDSGYTMMYGDANRNKEFKKIDTIDGEKVYGRGYIANGGEIAREFYSPYVPFDKGWSFLDEFLKVEPLPPLLENTTLVEKVEAEVEFEEEVEEELEMEEISDMENHDLEEKTYDVVELGKRLDVKPRMIRHVVKLIKEANYRSFSMVDGAYQFTSDDAFLLKSLFEKKEDFEGDWKALLKGYFEGD